MFPPEPPVAITYLGRNGAQPSRARREFGASKRTLDGEHRSGILDTAYRRAAEGEREHVPAGGL